MEMKDMDRLCELARLDIAEGEKATILASFDSILAYIGQIKDAATGTYAPSAGANYNSFRDDVAVPASSETRDAIIEAFPEREGDYLKVPKVL